MERALSFVTGRFTRQPTVTVVTKVTAEPLPAASHACGELKRSGHVLAVTILSYFMLSFMHTHLAAFVMVDAVTDIGVSITTYTLATGIGNLIKCAAIAAAGPLMDRLGAHTVANATLGIGIALVATLAASTSRATFLVTIAALIGITGFAEQPTYVVVSASHLEVLLSLMTTSITASFSASGAILPLLLSPVLQSRGCAARSRSTRGFATCSPGPALTRKPRDCDCHWQLARDLLGGCSHRRRRPARCALPHPAGCPRRRTTLTGGQRQRQRRWRHHQ